MNELKLNETPLRTSRNFLINNIKINDLDIPTNLEEFSNVKIEKTNSIIDKQTSNKELTYGTGKVLEDNINKNANNRIKILTSSKKENIKIEYIFDDQNLNLINDIELIVDGQADIVIVYKSNTNKMCFHNGRIKLNAKNASNVNITIVNLLNNVTNNFEEIENEIEDNSNVKYTIIDIGGRNSVSNYYSNIIGENAKNDLKTIYLGIENQVKDINYIAELKGKKSEVNIDVQGALNDKSKKNFKGTIDFKKGSKKSKGSENEYCMLLSDNAKSIALPMLLCTEDDVEGEHSTASGKVEQGSLFYIMSRGISYNEAIKLIVRARFNKILERIENEKLKQEIIHEIDKRLD